MQKHPLTRPAVLRTLRRAARIGGAVFALRHGFRPGRYFVRWKGAVLPSKAVAGVAAGRDARAFSGGAAHVVRSLRRLGFEVVRAARVALVACSAAKRAVASAASELYVGQLFRRAVAYARAQLDGFVVLSGKHGVLAPEQLVAPYDQRVPSGAERAAWGERVLEQLRARFAPELTTFVLLCGRDYRRAVEHSEFRTVNPLSGLRGIGEMLRWLQTETNEE